MSAIQNSRARSESGTMLPVSQVRVPVFAFGLSLSLFFLITYVLCVAFDLIFPAHAMYKVWAPLLPGFNWLTWQSFWLGLIESFAYGWYVALVFGPLFNLCARQWK